MIYTVTTHYLRMDGSERSHFEQRWDSYAAALQDVVSRLLTMEHNGREIVSMSKPGTSGGCGVTTWWKYDRMMGTAGPVFLQWETVDAGDGERPLQDQISEVTAYHRGIVIGAIMKELDMMEGEA